MKSNTIENKLKSCCQFKMRYSGDYILSEPGTVKNQHIPHHYRKFLASDHFPVIADINEI